MGLAGPPPPYAQRHPQAPHPVSQTSEAYPDCPACTWGRHAGSWPLEHGKDSSQVSEDSWVPGGGGEYQDRQKGGPTVKNETGAVCGHIHNRMVFTHASQTSSTKHSLECYHQTLRSPAKEQSFNLLSSPELNSP